MEVLLAVAVIGMLASATYPSYIRYLERSLRTDAQAGLLQAASELEHCYSRHHAYTDCTISSLSPDGNYMIVVTDGRPDDGGFLVTAVSSHHDGCVDEMTLNARGERLPEVCW